MTQIEHVYSTPSGLVWRKRWKGNILCLSLKTRERTVAQAYSTKLVRTLLELSPLSLSHSSLKEELGKHRDEMYRRYKLGLPIASPSDVPPSVQSVEEKTTSSRKSSRTLRSVMAEYMKEKERDWKLKTSKENRSKLEAFLSFCNKKGVNHIEDVTKPVISAYKLHMDALSLAPQSKQLMLDKISAMFKFAVEMREYIATNPFSGMNYKKVRNISVKEEISPSQYSEAMSRPENSKYRWLIAVFYHTGMRRAEIRQITKEDYREIDGVKCISINTDNGKTVKNESSIRNIPLNNTLLEMGIWEENPVFGNGDRTIDVHVSKSFEAIGLKRTTHCFRHSLSNRLRDTNANDSTRAFILGHAQTLITDRVYATRTPLMQMKDALDKAGSV